MSDSVVDETIPADMESSSFSQVVFIDVPRSYPPNTPVRCFYSLTGGLKPNPRDWIGVFKVGWNSTKNYISYVWVDSSYVHGGEELLKEQVVFAEYYLPKDDGEFYQFCYVDSSGQVKGASTPFCFQDPAETSLDSSLEKDLVVITTQEQAEQMEKEKEGLLHEIEHMKDENKILKNELDERLHEIHRLRVRIDELKLNGATRMPPQNKLSFEGAEHFSHEQLLTPTVEENETKQENESVSREKYDQALQKIIAIKQEKIMLKEQSEALQAEILKLSSTLKELEQDFNRLQDHKQLLQVDVQSSQKENERLQGKIKELMEMKRELEGLREENKTLRGTLSEQGSSEGDINNTKMQIQALLGQLTEARGMLRKEVQVSNEANKRADKAELELKELKSQLEQRKVTEKRLEACGHLEVQLKEAQRRITEQTDIADAVRLEKNKLTEDNKRLEAEVERLKRAIYDLQVATVAASQLNNPSSPLSSVSVSGQEEAQSTPFYYESLNITGIPSDTQTKVCRHCQECFPDIREDELAIHEQSHKVCPFCTLICDDLNQQQFEDHVYSHGE